MKISVPLVQVLRASGIENIQFREQETQQLLSHSRPSNQDGKSLFNRHPLILIGSPLNWHHTARISVGTPPQYFNAVLDISTSDLIIPNERPPRKTPPPLHAYNSSKSSTYRPNGTQISSNPLGIQTSGILSQDTFDISDLSLKDSLFEEATQIDLQDCGYCGGQFDTVLPLGPYNDSSPRNFMSPVASLVTSRLLDENIFSLRMSRTTDDGVGQLVLGGRVEDSFIDGEEVTIPVTDIIAPYAEDGNWKVVVESLTLGDGLKIHHSFKRPTVAVFATTYVWIGLPESLTDKLNKFMGAKTWGPFAFVNCAKRPNWPDLTIKLAGQEFVLTSYDYVVEQNEGGRISCMSAFYPAGEDEALVIFLGSAFLKTWVTVWDWEHQTVGFTKARHAFVKDAKIDG